MSRRLSAGLVVLLLGLAVPANAAGVSWGVAEGDGGRFCGSGLASGHKEAVRGPLDEGVVLPQTWFGVHARLNTHRKFYRAGSVVIARTENIGTERLEETWEYEIERLTQGSWRVVGPKGQKYPRSPGPQIAPGRAVCATSFKIPDQAASGHYRIVKQVEYGSISDEERPTLTLTREFSVKDRLELRRPKPRSGPNPYCRGAVVRDYERVFRRLPAVQPPPLNERLSFGPSGIEVFSLRPDAQRIGIGWVSASYGIHNTSFSGSIAVDWRLNAALSLLDGRGQPIRVVDRNEKRIGQLQYGDQALVNLITPEALGIYRVDLAFFDGAGVQLGAYSDYVRVVPGILDVRLGTQGRAFHHGDTVFARVENFGTEAVRYAAPFRVERSEGSTWAVLPGPRVWPRWLGMLPAGTAGGRCTSVTIRNDFPPGIYRLSKTVWHGPEPRSGGLGESLALTKEFTVLP